MVLYEGEGFAHVVVGMGSSNSGQRPGATRVGMGINQLRVCDEDKMVRRGVFGLWLGSARARGQLEVV